MKILFIMQHQGYIRNFKPIIELLAERGHHVDIVFSKEGTKKEWVSKSLDNLYQFKNKNITIYEQIAPKRNDRWASFAKIERSLGDYLRYFDKRYVNANKLKERAARNIPHFVQRIISKASHPWVLGVLKKLLSLTEELIPPSKEVNHFIARFNPDIVLVTPLVDIASDQTDYIKSAKALGIKNGLCVHSWDNLTNKGLMRCKPDLVVVWNEIQKKEAVELHGISPSHVVVTGAQCYDKWFERTASYTRSEFCNRVGLTQEKPFILYLCSSPFIAPNEVDFVREWVKSIRHSDCEILNEIGILIRPHPQNAKQWKEADLSEFLNVIVYPRVGENPIGTDAENLYFDSIYHSTAVVGINTSALIEAGILLKPVFTIKSPEFKDTQDGTLHFHYLSKGGLLYIAEDFTEHITQLREILEGNESYKIRIRNFIKEFVRPHGLDVPSTPIFVDVIERLGSLTVSSQKLRRITLNLLSIAIIPFMTLSVLLWQLVRLNNEKKSKVVLKEEKFTLRLIKKFLRLSISVIKFLKLAEPVKSHIAPIMEEIIVRIEDTAKVNFDHNKKIKKEITRFATNNKSIIIGPWLSEIGFELLYWIPFLKWVVRKYNIDSNKIVVISRGGAKYWYKSISEKYYDIFDYFSPQEFKQKNIMRIQKEGFQKHVQIGEFDREILNRIGVSLNMKDFNLLHPSIMYRLFMPYWREAYSIKLIGKYTVYEKFDLIDQMRFKKLPKDYVAVKFYFSVCFPDTKQNRAFVSNIIYYLSKNNNVIVMNTNLDIDDHREFKVTSDNVFDIKDLVTPQNNLIIQTQIISRAKAFFCTYGGFSYLGPFYSVPTFSFYSDGNKFIPLHLDVAYRALRSIKYGSFHRKIKDKNNQNNQNKMADLVVLNIETFDVFNNIFKIGVEDKIINIP